MENKRISDCCADSETRSLLLGATRVTGLISGPGDLVLLMGFGAGLTWGACLLEWGHAGASDKHETKR